jgi:Spy/CpxP family protein refolding chaperone
METDMARTLLVLALLTPAVAGRAQEHDPSRHAHAANPYAGQESREIKALSADEIRQLLEGHGAGLARPAELNHYPGPRHVLDLARGLELSAAQEASTREVFDRMRERALALGPRLVEQERRIERFFASGETDTAGLAALLAEAGRLQAELRLVHLQAHVAMRGILRREQVARYDALRGYATP